MSDVDPLTSRPVRTAGLLLRYALVVVLHDHGGPLTVRQLCAALQRQGLAPPGRASKAVSDALRWEVDRGRVRRMARGTYVLGLVARQTIWRMRRRVAAHRAGPGWRRPRPAAVRGPRRRWVGRAAVGRSSGGGGGATVAERRDT